MHGLKLDDLSWALWGRRKTAFFGHRVLGPREPEAVRSFFRALPGQALEAGVFAQRLRQLRRHYEFLPTGEWLAMEKTGERSGLACLSFDDAYADFLRVIPDLLRTLRIPATFFVTVQPIERTRLLWFDQVYSSFIGARVTHIDLDGVLAGRFDLRTASARAAGANQICSRLVPLGPSERQAALDEFIAAIGPGAFRPETLYLSAAEVHTLAQIPGVSIGSHTMSHAGLTALTEEQLEWELAESKTSLERITDRPVCYLSYPNSLWDDRVAAVARRCGYRAGFATFNGNGDAFACSRVNLGWWSLPEFAVRTSPLGTWFP
jgi:peptidoglycan/xylan/chitin deacetylase (PgdA/CDA1 family)